MKDFNFRSIADLFGEDESVQEKVAEEVTTEEAQASEEQTHDHEKIAQDLYFGGCILAEGFVDRALEKIAMSVPAGGGGVGPRSKWDGVREKIQGRRTISKPGFDLVDADDKGYPGHGSQSGRSLKQAKNPAKALK